LYDTRAAALIHSTFATSAWVIIKERPALLDISRLLIGSAGSAGCPLMTFSVFLFIPRLQIAWDIIATMRPEIF